ncbi:MAG TPA: cation:proton antiporter [Vicinamibacterales bacterium]
MHGLDLILTLTAGLVAAFVGGFVTQRLRLSPIVGYLIAGILVGPYTPGFVADRALAEQLAEIGVILLMFGVGLQFHVEDLLAVKRVAVPGAVVQSLTATAFGALLAQAAGWSLASGIVFGIALSVASTVVLIRVLSDYRQLHTPAGHIAVGWLVVEDLFTVLVLVLMPAWFDRSQAGSVPAALGWAALKVTVLTLFTIVVGGRTIPWLLAHVSRTGSRELFTLAVLATALGIAVASAEIFGVSMALGAFLAGLVVGRSDFSVRAASDALPMRDAFAVLFFVSVGMLLDPAALFATPVFLFGTLGIILLGKPAAALAIVLLFRYPLKTALAVAVALAQIGEFSFIVATLANQLGVLTIAATNTLVGAAIMSITLNPLLFRAIRPVERWLSRRTPVRVETGQHAAQSSGTFRAVVVGYGPVGRTVTRLLRENDITPTLIEMNVDTVRELRAAGLHAVHGDATHPDVLAAAGIAGARGFIVSAAGLDGIGEAFSIARQQNPGVQILARATLLSEVPRLRAAGADTVVSGEGEVALAFTTAILENLGATRDQIDRERVRVRTELGQ